MPNPSDVRALVDEARELASRLVDEEWRMPRTALYTLPQLLDRLASALEAREWQPIETAPKDGTEFDGLAVNGFRVANCYWCDDGFYRDGHGASWRQDLSHWMPLPAAPTPEPAGEGEKP